MDEVRSNFAMENDNSRFSYTISISLFRGNLSFGLIFPYLSFFLGGKEGGGGIFSKFYEFLNPV